MDLDGLAWLLSADGTRVLAAAASIAAQPDADPLRCRDQLARAEPDTAPEHLALALTQVDLRERAVAKFGDLGRAMHFTRDGLEQATRLSVAEHRAARLRAFGAASVIDLGCGIGGDLIALSRAGLIVAGVDLDPVRAALAQSNLDALGLPGAVSVADATAVDVTPFDVAFVDPARRTARGRTFDLRDLTPPWAFAEALLGGDAVVKAAPGLPHHAVPAGVEAEWVSDHGEVKEACLWGGRLATTARRATVLGDGGLATLTDQDDPGPEAVGVGPVGRFLYEPDGAVIRAGLVTAVAAAVEGALVDSQIAYISAADAVGTPFARGYEVLDELPFRERALKSALRERGIGRLSIKKRGVDVVPESLRRRLDLRGDAEATIVLTRAAGTAICLLVRPL